ncbi:MAG: Do family serine endopeptidase [Desulfobacterales bacterium]|jgi:Do/DeqQ family serine protease|nr:Do family serine endopeptidase [Desulfobacterales bacterium]
MPTAEPTRRISVCSCVSAFLVTLILWPLLAAGAEESLRESPIVKAVRKARPAVVNISSAVEARTRPNPFSGFGFRNPFFEEFFKDFFDPGFEQRRQTASLGSGVIIDGERGLILTNAHVIQRSGTITVVLEDRREFEARIIGADPDSDLAVLKIDATEKLPAIAMGQSDDLMIGETVIAIGNPFGFSHTVTTGVVSAIHRSIRADDRVLHDFIQIDASINPGNSGGPLLNINGELVGINTAIYAKAQGIGFAIPISKAKKIVANLIQYGEVQPAWIGIAAQELDERLAQYLKYPGRKGAMIRAVEPGSPAQAAGLREGDVLLAVGPRKIADLEDYMAATRAVTAGETLEIQAWRNGRTLTAGVRTRLFPVEKADELAWDLLGVRIQELTAKNRREHRISAREGVLVTEVKSGSQLARIGARPGDVIRQIDDAAVSSSEEFRKAVIKSRYKSSVVLLIQRGEQGYYVTVDL